MRRFLSDGRRQSHLFLPERRGFIHGKESHLRQCAENSYLFLPAIFVILFFADTLRHGGSVYYRAVWRRGWDDGGLGRQSGHAYADGYDRWSGDGRNGSHRTRGRRG